MILDYKKMTLKDMYDYLLKEHNDDESKKAFRDAYIEIRPKTTYVTVYESDGKPKVYIDKNGKTKVKKKKVPVKTGEKIQSNNLLKAKKYFYETYKSEIDFTNVPTAKKQTVNSSLTDEIANW